MYLGNIIVSVGYQHKWPWPAIVVIGCKFLRFFSLVSPCSRTYVNGFADTCAGIQVAAIPGIVSTYAVDSYKPVAGSLFVAITVNKNVWGYGFSKFITVSPEKTLLGRDNADKTTELDHQGWLHPTYHDECVFDSALVSLLHHLLLLRQDLPTLVKEQQRASDVKT